MTLVLRGLNFWLRRVEKNRLRKGTPAQLRRALEVQSKLAFHPPRGTRQQWQTYGDIPCLEVTPRGSTPDRVLFYIHGGGFVFGSPDTHSAMAARLAHAIGARAVMPRYRCAPEHACPAASEDVRAAWDGLIAGGMAPGDIVIGGDSAGGALAFGLVSALCAEGMALPGAVFGLSPLADLTFCSDSLQKNADCDVILPAERAAELAELFLQGQRGDAPGVSPIFGAFHGAPPAWITVGDTEILLDDACRLAARLQEHGVDITLKVEHDLPHVWPIFHNILPEARKTLGALAQWIRQQQNWEV